VVKDKNFDTSKEFEISLRIFLKIFDVLQRKIMGSQRSVEKNKKWRSR